MKYGPHALALALILSNVPVAAQDAQDAKGGAAADNVVTTTYSDWIVQCEKETDGKKQCGMGQGIRQQSKDGKQTVVVTVEIGFFPEEDNATMLIAVPLGVNLPPGMQLKIDAGEPVAAPFQVCGPKKGCLAAFKMDAKLVAALKRGKEGKIAFVASGKPAVVPISLNGFTKAYGHIAAAR